MKEAVSLEELHEMGKELVMYMLFRWNSGSGETLHGMDYCGAGDREIEEAGKELECGLFIPGTESAGNGMGNGILENAI